jgi:hypothetical protein
MSQHGAQRPPAPQQSPVQRSSSQPGPGEPGRFGFPSREPADLPATVPADLKRRRSLIIGVVVALIVLALIAVLVTTILQRRGSAASGAQADAVQGYLSAVAAGDSERALGYLAERPDNAGLLTDKVLAASNKIAPITAISVSEPQKGSNTVQAWYKIGDQRYQQQFTVQARGDSYVLDGGTATADLSSLPKGLSYKLDGASIQRKTVALFPGSYRISADSRLYDLGQQSEFVAVVHDRLSISLTPRLTSTGQKSVKTAIDDAIKDCLASKKLKAGCGLTLTGNGPGSFTVKDGSIKRSLSKEASRQLDRLELITDDADPTLIRTTGISGNIRTEATCERDKSGKRKGKKTKDCILRGAGTSLDSPQVRVSGDELKVEWF